jgi:hypothetical protein
VKNEATLLTFFNLTCVVALSVHALLRGRVCVWVVLIRWEFVYSDVDGRRLILQAVVFTIDDYVMTISRLFSDVISCTIKGSRKMEFRFYHTVACCCLLLFVCCWEQRKEERKKKQRMSERCIV